MTHDESRWLERLEAGKGFGLGAAGGLGLGSTGWLPYELAPCRLTSPGGWFASWWRLQDDGGGWLRVVTSTRRALEYVTFWINVLRVGCVGWTRE